MGKRAITAFLLIIAVATFSRFYRISHHSLWDDEIATADTVKQPIAKLFVILATQDAAPPLFYLLAHDWVKAGYSEAWLRALAAIFSVASVVVIFLFAQMLFGLRAAVFSGLVSALWPLGVYSGQEFRSYALLIFFSSLTFFSFAALLYGKKWAAWVFPVSLALGFVTHYYFVFVLAVIVLYFILWWLKAWKIVQSKGTNILRTIYCMSKSSGISGKASTVISLGEFINRLTPWMRASVSFIFGLVLVAVAFVFWLKFFLVQLVVVQSWRPYVEPWKILADLGLGLTVSSLPMLNIMRSFWLSWPFLVVLLGWTILMVSGIFVRAARLYIVGSFLGFVALLVLVCKGIHIFDLRAAICIFPIFAIWVGSGFDNLWVRKGFRPVALAASIAIFAGSLGSIYHHYFDPRFERQNWKDAAKYVRLQMAGDTPVASYLRFKALGLEYYLHQNLTYLIDDVESFSKLADRDQFLGKRADEIAKNCRVVLLDYHGRFLDPHNVLRERLRKDHTLVEVKSFASYDPRADFSIFVYDCAKKIDDVSLSESIDFSRLDSEPQILDGFSQPIAGGRFMGERGKIVLSTQDATKRCFELIFYVNLDFFDGEPFKVKVEQNGVERGSVVVDKTGIFNIRAPIDVFLGRPTVIDIFSEKTFVPSEVIRTDETIPRSINAVSAGIVKCP